MPGKKRGQSKKRQTELKKIKNIQSTQSDQDQQTSEIIEEENKEKQIINQGFSIQKLEKLSQELKLLAPSSSLQRVKRTSKSIYASNQNRVFRSSLEEQEIFRQKLLEIQRNQDKVDLYSEVEKPNIHNSLIQKEPYWDIKMDELDIAPQLNLAPKQLTQEPQSPKQKPTNWRKNKIQPINTQQVKDNNEFTEHEDEITYEKKNSLLVNLENNRLQNSETKTDIIWKFQVEKKPLIIEFENDYQQESQESNNQKRVSQKPFYSLITDTEDVKIKPKKTNSLMKQYSSVIESLNENALPSSLACRDQEKQEINNFLKAGLKQRGQSQVLYISGVPGIGKTACVLEIIEKLKQAKEQFIFVHINAMNLSAPENLYNQLLEDLTGNEGSSKSQACLILNDIFTKGKYPDQQIKTKQLNDICKQNKIILIDECDQLITPNQQLLYNLLQWPSQQQSHLNIVMIANTMDFPERLKPKLQSRIGNHRIVFKPYNSAQIDQIIQQRLQSISLFQTDSIQFLAKKIATVSSDIRRTLQICRLSVELAKEEYQNNQNNRQLVKVTIDHIKEAYAKIYSYPYHSCLQQLNDRSKLLLLSIALDIIQRGQDIAYLSTITNRFNQITQNYFGQISQLTQNQILDHIGILEQLNLCESKIKKCLLTNGAKKTQQIAKGGVYNNTNDYNLILKISIDDLKNSLKDDQTFIKLKSLF